MDVTAVSSQYGAQGMPQTGAGAVKRQGFDAILSSAMSMINETNALQNAANQEKIAFALGEAENTHDLLIAEQKATIALQYTTAVRDKFIEGYKEIMNMQV